MIVATPEAYNGVPFTRLPKKKSEDRSGIHCVYLTEYFGSEDLPPLYIGVSYLERVTERGYRGSSKDPVYLSELRYNPSAFHTTIIETYQDVKSACIGEAEFHAKFDVRNNPWFWNKASSNGVGFPLVNEEICRSEIWKIKHAAAAKKRSQDPVWRAEQAAGCKKRSQDPVWRAKQAARNRALARDPIWRAKNAAACKKTNKKRSQDPIWRAKNAAANKKKSKYIYLCTYPDGAVATVSSLIEFSELNGLNRYTVKTAAKRNGSHKGYSFTKIPKNEYHGDAL